MAKLLTESVPISTSPTTASRLVNDVQVVDTTRCAFCEGPIDQPHPLGLCSKCDVKVQGDELAIDADPRLKRTHP